MQVRDLIEELEKLDPGAEVKIQSDGCQTANFVECVPGCEVVISAEKTAHPILRPK